MATTTPNYGLRKPAVTDHVSVKTDISDNMDLIDAHAHIGTLVALVAAPGGVDDTALIHAARDLAGVNGRLVFSAGTYVVAGLTENLAGQKWDLSGLTTLQLKASAGTAVLNVAADDFTLTGGIVDGNRTNQTTGGSGITNGQNGLTLDGIYIKNCYGYGFQGGTANTRHRIQRCRIENTRLTGVAYQAGLNQLHFSQNVLDMSGLALTGVHGLQVYDTTLTNFDLVITDNVIRNVPTGVGGGGPIEIQQAERVTVTGNHCDGGRLGLTIGSASYLTASNNVIRNMFSYGFELGSGSYQTITGNVIESCAVGIYFTALAATDVTVASNTIMRCNGPSNGDAIRVSTTSGISQRINIVGNTITDNVDGSLITVAAGATDVLIADNVLTQTGWSNISSGVLIRVGGGTRVKVVNNQIATSQTSGLSWVGAILVDGTVEDVQVAENTVIALAATSQNGIQLSSPTITKVDVFDNYVNGFNVGITNGVSGHPGAVTDRIHDNVVENCTTRYGILASSRNTRTKRVYEAAAAPTAGTWTVGDIVWNSNPTAAAQATGWVCTVAGTPGTWRSIGITDVETSLAALAAALPAAFTDDYLITGGGEAALSRMFGASADVVTVGSGGISIVYFTAKRTEAITKVRMRTGATAAGATPTLCRIGIWTAGTSGDATALVGDVANDTTLFAAANTTYTRSLSQTWNKVAGTRYGAAAILVTGAAVPTFIGAPQPSGASGSLALGSTPRINGFRSGYSDLPSTFDATISNTSRLPQFEFLP